MESALGVAGLKCSRSGATANPSLLRLLMHVFYRCRHQGNEARPGQGLSPECAQQPSISSQPISTPCGGEQEISSGRHGTGSPRNFGCRDEEETPCMDEPGSEACDAHSIYKAAGTAKPCEPASAEKLGLNFERLVASFQNRKAQHPSGCSGRTYSNPVYTANTLSDSLQALKARSAGATSSHSGCPTEDAMTSTAATKRPRSPAMRDMPAQPQQNTAGAGHHVMSGAVAGCAKQGHQVGPVSRIHGDQRSAAGKVAKHAASITEQQHGDQSAQGPQLTNAAAAALSEQTARKHVGRYIAHVGRAAMGLAEMGMHATQAPPRPATATSLVTPADISAEATERVCLLWCLSLPLHTALLPHGITISMRGGSNPAVLPRAAGESWCCPCRPSAGSCGPFWGCCAQLRPSFLHAASCCRGGCWWLHDTQARLRNRLWRGATMPA